MRWKGKKVRGSRRGEGIHWRWSEESREKERRGETEDVRSEGHWAARNLNNKDIIFPKCMQDKEEEKKHFFFPFILCFVSDSDKKHAAVPCLFSSRHIYIFWALSCKKSGATEQVQMDCFVQGHFKGMYTCFNGHAGCWGECISSKKCVFSSNLFQDSSFIFLYLKNWVF